VSATPFSIAILGNDAWIAASPALPVQLMHAALAAGFDAVVPSSLGDELVAAETLRIAQLRGRRPIIQCSCPFSLTQLCKREANLADVTIAVAPAAVALARALRLDRTDAPHITYIGTCPGAQDPAIDLQVSPEAFLRGLQQKGITLSQQPDIFTDRLPPDRRRYLSLPGGAPRPEFVHSALRRDTVALTDRMNPLLAVADALFDGGVTMIDPAGAYHCACAGAGPERTVADGRIAIEKLEPPRATAAIFDAPAWLDLRPTETAVLPAVHDERAVKTAPVAFADATRIDVATHTAHTVDQTANSENTRRMYALGVRTARRRSTTVITMSDEGTEMIQLPVPSLLRAQPMEREVPLQAPRPTLADSFIEPPAPAPRRRPASDELFNRD
jgi:hypothetical protein